MDGFFKSHGRFLCIIGIVLLFLAVSGIGRKHWLLFFILDSMEVSDTVVWVIGVVGILAIVGTIFYVAQHAAEKNGVRALRICGCVLPLAALYMTFTLRGTLFIAIFVIAAIGFWLVSFLIGRDD